MKVYNYVINVLGGGGRFPGIKMRGCLNNGVQSSEHRLLEDDNQKFLTCVTGQMDRHSKLAADAQTLLSQLLNNKWATIQHCLQQFNIPPSIKERRTCSFQTCRL